MGLLSFLADDPAPVPRNPLNQVVAGAQLAGRVPTVELLCRNLLSGLANGDYQTNALGSGWDKSEARRYEFGDDVRRIDWYATARTAETQFRPSLAERELLLGIVIDASRSMNFGTESVTKYELALSIAVALAEIAVRGGNAVACCIVLPQGPVWFPLVGTRSGVQVMLHQLCQPYSLDGNTNLSEAMWQLVRLHPRCRSIVVCSDFRDKEIEFPFRALSSTHQISAFELYDRRERNLVDIGDAVFAADDVVEWLDTGDQAFLKRYAEVAEQRANERAQRIHDAGASHVAIRCSQSWPDDVIRSIFQTVARFR